MLAVLDHGSKPQYSEVEAAAEIGISVEELRALIRDRITGAVESPSQPTLTVFQASDIVLLRILSQSKQPLSV